MVYRLLHRDGRYRWVTDRGAPYHDARGTFLGYLGSCLDITDRVELEAKLEQQSQHKSRLMSALSHDARTPLNAVVLSAKLLESQVKDQDDPEVQECLRTIRNAVRNVLDLLSDLLDLSRIDAGATLAESSRFPLRATLAECLSSIEPQARAKGLDVRLDAGDLADARLETDRAKLKQILSNLLSNALRYTEKGHIRLFASRADGRILIGVEDTGVGIAEADQQRIFDEFAVLEHPNRPRGEGTGLGLAICRRLANLLQGEILLESAPGRGSTFTLALPDSVLTDEPARRARPAGRPRPRLRRGDPDRRGPRRQPQDPGQGPPADGLPGPRGRRRPRGPRPRPPGAADGRPDGREHARARRRRDHPRPPRATPRLRDLPDLRPHRRRLDPQPAADRRGRGRRLPGEARHLGEARGRPGPAPGPARPPA